MLKFLIDECLSEELVSLARNAGYRESSHVRRLGKGGFKDWQLMPVVLEGDWTLVTNNSYDFRGDPAKPGTKGFHSKEPIHAGLVCLNFAEKVKGLHIQEVAFDAALVFIGGNGLNLINRCVEVTVAVDGSSTVVDYSLPI